MTTTTLKTAASSARTLAALFTLVKCELLKLARVPAFIVPTLLFPVLFFTLFALPNVRGTLGGVNAGQYLTVSYAAYALLSVALFSFGVSVAAERGLGWTALLRVTPMQPALYMLAKTLSAMLLGLISVSLLIAFATLVGGVRFEALTLALVVVKLLLGMLTFVGLGLCIGYLGGPNSAAAIANVIFLPLSFASGLFVPIEFAPKFLQILAPYMPGYHFAQLGWGTLGAQSHGRELTHWLWLLSYGALFYALALWAYKRDEGRRFG